MMAASLVGSSPALSAAFDPAPGSGREAGPVPKAELSSTRVAISSGTPSLPEGCANCRLSSPISVLELSPELPLAAPFATTPGPVPGFSPPDRAETCGMPVFAISGPNPDLPIPAPANSNPLPSPGNGRSTASPSGGKPAAKRIDRTFQRMGNQSQGKPTPPRTGRGLAVKPRW